jgi:uncharacterized RDD family membrane protein YckC
MISAPMAFAAALTGSISERALEARRARTARFLAMVLDLVVLGILSLIVNNNYGVPQITSGSPLPFEGGAVFFTSVTAVPWPWLVLLWMAYFIVPETLFGASLGKWVNGLRVVRLDGGPMNTWSIAIRNVLRLVDVLPGMYLLGGLLVLLSGSFQRLGDMAAGTTVIFRADAHAREATKRLGRRTRQALGVTLVAALAFTVAFNYFGRAPILVQSQFNQHQLLAPGLSSYRLGTPTWGLGRVTYPVYGTIGSQACSGSLSLTWTWTGWEMTDGQLLCPP